MANKLQRYQLMFCENMLKDLCDIYEARVPLWQVMGQNSERLLTKDEAQKLAQEFIGFLASFLADLICYWDPSEQKALVNALSKRIRQNLSSL